MTVARGEAGRTGRDDGVVAGVNVDRLVEWELGRVRDDRAVHGRVENRDARLGQARDELLDVANALCRNRGVTGAVRVPEAQI